MPDETCGTVAAFAAKEIGSVSKMLSAPKKLAVAVVGRCIALLLRWGKEVCNLHDSNIGGKATAGQVRNMPFFRDIFVGSTRI